VQQWRIRGPLSIFPSHRSGDRTRSERGKKSIDSANEISWKSVNKNLCNLSDFCVVWQNCTFPLFSLLVRSTKNFSDTIAVKIVVFRKKITTTNEGESDVETTLWQHFIVRRA
jgi:hypothetical protein